MWRLFKQVHSIKKPKTGLWLVYPNNIRFDNNERIYRVKKIKIKVMQWVIKYKLGVLGLALGSVSGWLYWKFVGCSSGSCAITSVWYNSTLYGAVMGWLVFDMFRKTEKNRK